ncbi:hypothetical protein VUJ46_09675 [Chryseobacterium sp. MYb264]|uniref:hypothetical protein n=1 Tax=Chryseobacterium sp. MYb264 TaxID=2745153 RepID=UPI002E0E96DD|nr:hypothetical protein VUJ46_09675 [Chryseobacterium sp. MYb264]
MFFASFFNSQVGINTANPHTSLDIVGNADSTSSKDGVMAPRLTKQQLASKDSGTYSTSQMGAIVYITDITTPTGVIPSLSQTTEINLPGYYYFNGTTWKNMNDSALNIYNSNGSLTADRTVTQGTQTLSFTGTVANLFSVDGNTLSINAANHRVGIGNTAPSVKLDINSGGTSASPVPAIKIVDGYQAADKVLMSDANGVGVWRTPASIKPTATGIFPTSEIVTNSNGSGVRYLGVYIDLTQGKWVINAGLTLFNNTSSSRYWLHSYLSTSTTAIARSGFTHLGPAGGGTSFAGVIINGGGSDNDNTLNFLSGSSVINVTAATVRIYLLLENKAANLWRYSTTAQENYFYAVPIN